MARIGLIGAGNIGSQVARLAVAHGYEVVLSNSRGPETLTALITELGPKARAATVVEAATSGDIVVVAIPLKHYRAVPVEPVAGLPLRGEPRRAKPLLEPAIRSSTSSVSPARSLRLSASRSGPRARPPAC